MKTNMSLLLAVFTLTALACNSFVALPGTSLKTGDIQTFSIEEALPASASR